MEESEENDDSRRSTSYQRSSTKIPVWRDDRGNDKEKTDPGLPKIELVHPSRTLQDGGSSSTKRTYGKRRLHLQNRFKGRICSCPNPRRLPRFFKLRERRNCLPIQIPSVRPQCSTKGFLQNHALCYRTFKKRRNSHHLLFGRYLHPGKDETRDGPGNEQRVSGLCVQQQSNDDISTIFEDYQSNEEDSTVAYFSKENVQMDSRAWKEVESAVIDSQDEKSELVKEQVDFVEEYFRFCLLFKKGNLYKCLNISESNFSRLLVWPAVEVSIESMELLEFLPGEYLLKSSQEKYNADGCIVDEENNEMFLLEVSGKLLLNEKWKYGYDHVKCTFGALSIFNAAFKKYFFATEETAMKLQTPYLHAMEGSLHLWVLELCSNKLYISNKVFKCQIPKSMDDTKNIIAMGNLLWCLKMKLERVHNILKAMKEEHNNYEVQRMLGGSSRSRLSLVEMVSTEIQKPVKGEGYGILLPEEKDESDCNLSRIVANLRNPNLAKQGNNR
ncbi:hypothetical protein G6F21_011034 [Rhizopus arrhizus]|nr:hypothetical protein G6F21_011034 [Rhizopus arrhizus]